VIPVPVELGDRRYEVLVGEGARRRLSRMLAERLPAARRAAVVTQASLTAESWFDDVDPGLPYEVHTVPDGEEGKTPATVEALCRSFTRVGLSRADVVVAVGGGVVTDTAGFAAAVHHRGTAYVNLATSLLAQVDAAVGGKTGVNLPEGKNLMGAFWQPAGVLCDTEVLATLPPRELVCGRGEMAKYAFLTGDEPDASLLDLPLDRQVAACVAIKARVVADDEREGGGRAVLNYGHTLAHALEAVSGYDLRHGEAVAVGLVYAALLARRLGRIDDDRVDLHRRVVSAFDLPTELPPGADPEALLSFMSRDKKAHQDLTFVLDGPKGVEPVRGVDPALALATLAEMGADR
jgi:5-deoxy-5-amino-3-dehydroquinate synthase